MPLIARKTATSSVASQLNDLPDLPDLPTLTSEEKAALDQWWIDVQSVLDRNNDQISNAPKG